jgi:hypothetical protein
VIAGLTTRDFDKSMPSEVNPAIWQDVHKSVIEGRELYVKFTLDLQEQLLLISSRTMNHDKSKGVSGCNAKR